MNRVAQHPVQAFAAALAGVGLLSIMDAVMKGLVLALGIFAVSVWRSIANLALTGTLYAVARSPWPDARVLRIHLSRGAVVMVMGGLFFWGIGHVPLAQAIALTFIAPLIALLLASIFLHEQIGRSSLIGSFVAFAGVLVIVAGQVRAETGPDVLLGSAAIIGSALCYAVNIVLLRHQSLAAKPVESNFFQSLTILALWLAIVPFVGFPRWPAQVWPWVVVAALMSTAGGLIYSWAYARAQASYLAVSEYSGFLWAAALGWLVFHEPISLYTLGGALLIVGGCVVAASRRPALPPEIEVTA